MENSKIVSFTIDFLATLTENLLKGIVLEGVEEEAQVEVIKKLNHPQMYIQDYYYAKPMPLNEIEHFTVRN